MLIFTQLLFLLLLLDLPIMTIVINLLIILINDSSPNLLIPLKLEGSRFELYLAKHKVNALFESVVSLSLLSLSVESVVGRN